MSLRVNHEFQKSYVGEPLDVEFTYNRCLSNISLIPYQTGAQVIRTVHDQFSKYALMGLSVSFP